MAWCKAGQRQSGTLPAGAWLLIRSRWGCSLIISKTSGQSKVLAWQGCPLPTIQRVIQTGARCASSIKPSQDTTHQARPVITSYKARHATSQITASCTNSNTLQHNAQMLECVAFQMCCRAAICVWHCVLCSWMTNQPKE